MPVRAVSVPRRCSICQVEASKTANYCRICGQQLPSSESQLRRDKAGSLSGKGIKHVICSACGCQNMPGVTFCEDCGVQLPPVTSPPPSLPSRLS